MKYRNKLFETFYLLFVVGVIYAAIMGAVVSNYGENALFYGMHVSTFLWVFGLGSLTAIVAYMTKR